MKKNERVSPCNKNVTPNGQAKRDLTNLQQYKHRFVESEMRYEEQVYYKSVTSSCTISAVTASIDMLLQVDMYVLVYMSVLSVRWFRCFMSTALVLDMGPLLLNPCSMHTQR